MRASDWATMSRDVTRPLASASRISAMEASTMENGARRASTGTGMRTIATPMIIAAPTRGSRPMEKKFT